MARVTVEDCTEKVPNRFKLILMAAKRARDIERGAKPSVVRDNDKSTIVALREIAEEAISLENLENITKQTIVSNETELTCEENDEQVYVNDDEELKDEDEEDIESDEDAEDDDDWEISDNPYNRHRMSAEDTDDGEDSSLDNALGDLSDADLEDSQSYDNNLNDDFYDGETFEDEQEDDE